MKTTYEKCPYCGGMVTVQHDSSAMAVKHEEPVCADVKSMSPVMFKRVLCLQVLHDVEHLIASGGRN